MGGNTVKNILVLIAFAAALVMPVAAQDTLHVKSMHQQTAAEAGATTRYEQQFQYTLVTGTIGNRVYSLQSADNRLSRMEVGQDYPVVKLTGKTVDVQVPGKKHPDTLRFDVQTVEEK
jgi:hypothetical protein